MANIIRVILSLIKVPFLPQQGRITGAKDRTPNYHKAQLIDYLFPWILSQKQAWSQDFNRILNFPLYQWQDPQVTNATVSLIVHYILEENQPPVSSPYPKPRQWVLLIIFSGQERSSLKKLPKPSGHIERVIGEIRRHNKPLKHQRQRQPEYSVHVRPAEGTVISQLNSTKILRKVPQILINQPKTQH